MEGMCLQNSDGEEQEVNSAMLARWSLGRIPGLKQAEWAVSEAAASAPVYPCKRQRMNFDLYVRGTLLSRPLLLLFNHFSVSRSFSRFCSART